MNAYMNISVRVLSANAQAQIKALQAQVAALEGELKKANIASSGPSAIGSARGRKSLMAWGNQIQWTGRQIQYNWTLPILLAAGAATKFALDNEKAFTHVKKVYGSVTDAVAYFRKHQDQIPEGMSAVTYAAKVQQNELAALQESFVALSNYYGVAQKDVLDTAGAWAAAGASGKALAQSTNLSIKTAILGDMELSKATDSLIAIQAQYGLSTKQLGVTIAELNAIENQTGISMQGLIDGFARSAGVAREAGVDVRHLGAMLAALVPATGSAANAGNALKTIISRLMSPTKDAADVMREFGVDTADAAWESSTAMERLLILAHKMDTDLKKTGKSTQDLADDGYRLSDSQKQVVASVLGSRYQMNRFLVLMRELGPEQSYYEAALRATANTTKAFKIQHKELQAVLKSSPQRLKIIWTTIQNGMAEAITPMIPYFIYLAQKVADLVNWFANLSPVIQKFAIVALLALAAVGPLVRYFGSLLALTSAMSIPFRELWKGFTKLRTTTKLVNGALETTTLSIRAFFWSILTAPFKSFAKGMWSMISAVFGFLKAVALSGPVMTAFTALQGATMAAVAAIWGVGSTAVVTLWTAAMRAIILIQSGATGILFGRWTAALGAMFAATTAFVGRIGAVFASLKGITLGASVAMSFGWQIILGAAAAAYSAISYGWTALWVSMKAIMISGQIALANAWAAFKIVMSFGMSGIFAALEAAAVAGWVALGKIYAAGQKAIAFIMTAGGKVLTAIWTATMVSMQFIAKWGWRVVLGIFTAGALVLPQVLAASKRAIETVWAMIVAAQRTGALKAAAAALGPWALLAAAIIAVFVVFRRQIEQIWQNTVEYFSDSTNQMSQLVIRAWNALPAGVANALTAVAQIVHDAAMQIYEWFSYINPFAHHSPSLVENVTKGTAIVGERFKGMAATIKSSIGDAYADIKRFKGAASNLMAKAQASEYASQRKDVKKYSPGALGEFDALVADLKRLEPMLARAEAKVNKQQAVVDKWSAAVDRANRALDRQEKKLDSLTKVQSHWQDMLDAAQQRLSNYANAPIKGMQAMSDKIFANEMAQKKLRLEMMKMEDTVGTLDQIKSKIEAINGAQESLRGEQAALRSAGAGSEILGAYDEQIKKLDEQRDAQNGAAEALQNMSDRLDELQRKGEELDLINSLKFDPLTRQIEQAANAMKELPFDQIMAGVQAAQADISKYQDKLDSATKAVKDQQAVVDALTASKDALQARLDKENRTLDRLQKHYSDLNDAVEAVKSTLSDAASAAGELAQKAEKAKKKAAGGAGYVSPAVQNFRDAAGGNFANVGGDGLPIRTNWSDQTDAIQKFTDRMNKKMSNTLSDINPFNVLKDKWKQFATWLDGAWAKFKTAAGDMFSHMFDGVGSGNMGKTFSGMADKFKIAWATVKDWFQQHVINNIIKAWNFLAPSVIEAGRNAFNGLKEIWKQIGPELSKIWDEIKQLGPFVKALMMILKVALGATFAVLLGAGKLVASVIAKTIYPILQTLGNVIENVLQAIRGAIQIISGFFMLPTKDGDQFKAGLKKMGAGIYNLFSGLFGGIGQLIRGAAKTIIMAVWGIIQPIWDGFMWLWDELFGHSIIPDIVDGFKFWFKKLVALASFVWNYVVQPVYKVFKKLFELVIGAIKLWWAGVKTAWSVMTTAAAWWWDNVLRPIVDKVAELWDSWIQPALAAWWGGIQAEWAALKEAAAWLWDHVLHPILEKVVSLWKNHVRPALGAWWGGIKKEWSIIKTAAKWWWDNVLSPIFNKVKDIWSKHIRPALQTWWGGIKAEWALIKTAAKWWWDNVLQPIWNKVKDVWAKIKAELALWWSRITTVWERLKDLGQWVYDHVMTPVVNKIKSAWTEVKEWLTDNKDMLKKPVEGVVGVVVSAINGMIRGLNKVSDVLPGDLWNISEISWPPAHASGAIMQRRVGSGFKTNGARAIVGEGKANHPEFVIPTDPTHRRRAVGLLAMAAKKLNVGPGGDVSDVAKTVKEVSKTNPMGYANAVPQFGIGGWIHDKYDNIKKWGSELADLPQNAISMVMNPILNAAEGKVKSINYQPVESPPLYSIGKLRSWVSDSQAVLNDQVDKAGGGPAIQRGLAFARSMVGTPYDLGGFGPGGIDCSGFMSAIANVVKGRAPFDRSGRGTTATFPWGGWASGIAPGKGFTVGSTAKYPGSSYGHMAGTIGGVNVESRGGTGVIVGSGARGYNDSGFTEHAWLPTYMRGGMLPHALKDGGIALSRKGPIVAAMGDGRYDEAVVPLPKGWRNGLIGPNSGGKTININGDLSFPNITNGDDAKTFLDNLEKLAKD